jgi:DNA-binding Lrp family transcriptional regulator
MTSVIDKLDANLIATLRANPRVGLLEVARRLGVARGTVQARLAKLERTGVITGHGPEIDPSKLGYGVAAFVMIELAQGRLAEAVSVMDAMPELLEADGVSGPQDLICRVVAKDTEHLQQLVNELLRTPAIRRCTSYIVLSRQVPPRTLPLVQSAGGGEERPRLRRGAADTRRPRPASGSEPRASRESATRGRRPSSRP